VSIAIVLPTYNRLHLLRECVANVLSAVSSDTSEILIWNNGSTDGTTEFLDGLDDPRLRIVHHPENIGLNAFSRAYPMTNSKFLVCLDEDVVEAPPDWDRRLREAYERVPDVGYLATNLVPDLQDTAARRMYEGGDSAHLYSFETVNGVQLKVGPVGGWCAMTSRDLYDSVGGLPEQKFVYWLHDAEYIKRISKVGYRAAILDDVCVHHAGGAAYSETAPAKKLYWTYRARRRARRNAVKRMLLHMPLVPRLNRVYGWFEPPPKT
jgi:GT2 family glycosyltransferase